MEEADKLGFAIELNEKPEYNYFFLSKPERFIVDIKKAIWQFPVKEKSVNSSLLKAFRISNYEDKTRIVVDLKRKTDLQKILFSQKAKNNYQVTFLFTGDVKPLVKIDNIIDDIIASEKAEEKKLAVEKIKVNLKKPVIVIDAGHGGHDPGALGYRLKEKNITLEYAHSLKYALAKTGKYRVFYTRKSDYYIPLRRRIAIARKHKADLFISLHVDSAHNRKARGLSVYTLSEHASDAEAAALARKENRSDLVVGLDLSGVNKEVANVLIDLSQREGMNNSSKFAELLVLQLRKKVKMRKDTHRFAGFVVLKNPNMASVLIELGFISNRYDAKKLRSSQYRDDAVEGIVSAVDKYFR
jgi:N-acetylmuramoyl-L-alanine amidase